MQIQPFYATLGACITDVKLDLNLNKTTLKKSKKHGINLEL